VRRFALLALPSANRVYRASAPALALAELRILGEGLLGGRLREEGWTRLAGVPYLTFGADDLGPGDLAVLAHLSVFYALFEQDGAALRPVEVPPAERLDDDLVTVPKYAGKTNEQFTRLLLNVTAASSAAAGRLPEGGLVVLDPLCGRGTTLNQALVAGHDAVGVEHDGKDVEAYATFLRTWLERKRLKHKASFGPVRRSGALLGRRFEAEFAATKEQYRAGEVQRVTLVHADTLRTPDFVRPGSVDVVVTDAPYGVQHGSRAGSGGRTARSPLGLLEQALPVWVRALRPGGAVGISWNTLVAPRADLVHLLAAAGLRPLDEGPYRELAHRVDQAIVRDVVVGRLPE
jgi:SAM-dependent methyltransferase